MVFGAEDKDVPIFLKSVAEEVLNAGIHREFSRMKFNGEDKDIQDEAGKTLTFVSKMISELKALLLCVHQRKVTTRTILATTMKPRTRIPFYGQMSLLKSIRNLLKGDTMILM